jgi:predicted NBD/HSP70 family sugar kinase
MARLLERGLGAGIVINGPVHAANSAAGEIGFYVVE